MTNILIPTDFSPASFKMVEQAVNVLNRKVNIVLFHAYEMPFYYVDLFGLNTPPYYNLLNKGFWDNCLQLKTNNPILVNDVTFKSMQGNTNALFRNFLDANEIDLIVCPDKYEYVQLHDRSLNPIPFFKKSKLPLLQQLFNQPTMGTPTMKQQNQHTFTAA